MTEHTGGSTPPAGTPGDVTLELTGGRRFLWIAFLGFFVAATLCIWGIWHTPRAPKGAAPPVAVAAVAPTPASETPASSPSPSQSAATPAWDKPGWTLTFADEFDGAALDAAKWMDSYPGGVRTHSNNEQQYYAADGMQLEKGTLRLTAERRATDGMPYTSGMICSAGKFAQRYGWFEIRARFPRGQGLWPAFWLLPASGVWPPEIDVLEVLGQEPNAVHLTSHWRSVSGKREWSTLKFVGADLTADFHTFAVDWEPDRITWYVDGVERFHTTEHIPQEPMFLLANLAVGGDMPGMPDGSTPFPATMSVDYIRVYQRAP
jgi:beta-glucanase (GH16 family)